MAATGPQGLRLAREHSPDLITLDLLMPATDGWQLLDLLNHEADRFLPLTEGRKTHILHVPRILTVTVLDDGCEEHAREQLAVGPGKRQLLVKFYMNSGKEIIGKVSYVQPHEQERLLDYLDNSRIRFIPVQAQAQLVYVNRHETISALGLRGE